jgi:hypothetical protein
MVCSVRSVHTAPSEAGEGSESAAGWPQSLWLTFLSSAAQGQFLPADNAEGAEYTIVSTAAESDAPLERIRSGSAAVALSQPSSAAHWESQPV